MKINTNVLQSYIILQCSYQRNKTTKWKTKFTKRRS